MKRLFVVVVTCMLLSACNRQVAKEAAITIEPVATANTVFDLNKYKPLFDYSNQMDYVPLRNEKISPDSAADSLTVRCIYQDTIEHYYPMDEGSGNVFYSYLDTFKNFNIVCMLTGMGDLGGMYDLLTFTKDGHRISFISAGYLQGEEGTWRNSKCSVIKPDRIYTIETMCQYSDMENRLPCDSLLSEYKLAPDGKITLLKTDTVLVPQLDSLRRAWPW